jgi:N-methylhydantoinase A
VCLDGGDTHEERRGDLPVLRALRDECGDLGLRGCECAVGVAEAVELRGAAWGVERIVNANMANATRKVLASHGSDPRMLAMIAYGGNGAVHAWAIARELGIERVLVPKAAPAFSALGVLVADYVVDLLRAYVVPLSQVDVARVRELMHELQEETTKELEPTGLADTEIDIGLYAQMCYPGQNFDMSVPVLEGPDLAEPALLDLTERFHDQHEAERGFAFRNQQPLLRGVRLVARGRTPKPAQLAALGDLALADDARTGTREAYFGDGFVDAAVYDGTRFGPGAEVHGPALVEEPFTVVVVPPGARARIDDTGNYELTL